jgi:hypothetical protein
MGVIWVVCGGPVLPFQRKEEKESKNGALLASLGRDV